MVNKKRKIHLLYIAAIALLLLLSVFLLLPKSKVSNPGKQPLTDSAPHQQSPVSSPTPNAIVAPSSKSGDPETVEELSALIRKLSAQGGDTNALFTRLAPMRLPEKAWWQQAADFSGLLAVAKDLSVSEAGRIVALRFFLAGISKPELEKQSEDLQETFSNASDAMVSALLQDMADRQVAPRTLILQTLENPQREQNARCHAWYAARLTDSTNATVAALAIREYKTGWTTNSKVAFDYLAAAPHSAQFETAPALRQTVDDLVANAMNLPTTAGIMEMANADALIIALPKIMESARTKQTFLELLNNAPNPEVRLSALEQIVKLHTSGMENMTSDLASIKKNITNIFPDQAKKIRASAYLKRVQ